MSSIVLFPNIVQLDPISAQVKTITEITSQKAHLFMQTGSIPFNITLNNEGMLRITPSRQELLDGLPPVMDFEGLYPISSSDLSSTSFNVESYSTNLESKFSNFSYGVHDYTLLSAVKAVLSYYFLGGDNSDAGLGLYGTISITSSDSTHPNFDAGVKIVNELDNIQTLGVGDPIYDYFTALLNNKDSNTLFETGDKFIVIVEIPVSTTVVPHLGLNDTSELTSRLTAIDSITAGADEVSGDLDGLTQETRNIRVGIVMPIE